MLRVIEDTKLTNIADAIREKNRTEEQMTVDLMPDAIRSIQGGGSGEKVTKKDVNFYDYDGEILYSYTAAETAELTDMPTLPTMEGMICQGWNLTLDYVKAYTADYGKCDIGATYITDDGKTRLYIRIDSDARMELPLYFSQTVAHGVTIDWGDGSSHETVAGTGNVNTKHIYGGIGEYLITMEPKNGCELGFGNGTEETSIFGAMRAYTNMLQDIRIGRGVTIIDDCAFINCHSLVSITIPNSVTIIGECTFFYCYLLKSITIPNSVTSIDGNEFASCYGLKSIMIPNSVTSIGGYAFESCHSLVSITIPNSVASIYNDAFINCYGLKSIMIPNSVKSIDKAAFYGCNRLKSIMIPNSVTSIALAVLRYCYVITSITIPNSVTIIGDEAFYDCKSMKYYDFSKHTAVPTLENKNAFYNMPADCEIRVPTALLIEWKEKQNWNYYADHIISPTISIENIRKIFLIYENTKTVSLKYEKGYEWNGEEIIVNVSSSDETIVSIENIIVGEDTITFDAVSNRKEGQATITVSGAWGDCVDEKSTTIDVLETIPAATYSVEAIDGASYGFALNADGYYESRNKGVKNSAAVCKMKFDTKGIYNLYLDCINSGESNYDYGILSNVDTELKLTNTADTTGIFWSFKGKSSTDVQTVDYGILEAGEHFIYIKYRKDESGNSGNDSLQFKLRMEA